MTKKSITWFKRGAGSGGTGSCKEAWGSCKERPERQNRSSCYVEKLRDLVAQAFGPVLDIDIIPETELTKDDSNPFSFISGPKQAI